MNTSTSLFAKALATENIFVSFDSSAKTATFDVTSRTLIIPDWKVTDILRDMIVAHEVAHALFTPPEQLLSSLESAKERKLNPQGYKACINVIEDARIERLIKDKFPGCRRDFYSGYKEILDTDLFQLKELSPDDLTIVDKINLHFKFGLFNLMQIELSPPEQRFMNRVALAKTFEEVVALADELYAMAAEEEKQKGKGNGNFSSTGDLTEAVSKMTQRDGDVGKARQGKGTIKYEDFPHLSYPLPRCNSNEAIISFTDILQDNAYQLQLSKESNERSAYAQQDLADYITVHEDTKKDLEAFRSESKNTVRELVAQFERRKAAEEIRNERMKPSGTINPDRLHQFKTHDDIFLRNLVKHEGKKHGMVMVIDWSGSMGDCIDGVVRQVLTLTWFCRKAKIPFEVFFYTETGAFSDPALNKKYRENKTYEQRMADLYGKEYVASMTKNNNSFSLNDTSLRQVFSSSMNDEQQMQMEQLLWRMAKAHDRSSPMYFSHLASGLPHSMHMGGTPSCEALMVAHDFIPKFRAATGSHIVDFIFITDGEPTGLSRVGQDAYTPVRSVRVQHLPTGRTLTVKAQDRRGHLNSLNLSVQYFLVDEIRKLGCVTVGFSIGAMSGVGGHLMNKMVRKSTIDTTIKVTPELVTMQEKSDKVYNDFYKKENFLPCDTSLTPGFDEYYIVRPVKPVNSEMDDTVNATNSTLTKIRNQFLRSLNNRKVSRVFLARFIDLIAGRKVAKFRFMG